MLNVNRIERWFRAGQFGQILDALVRNGAMLPLALRVRLSAHPEAAAAMALRRVVELAWGRAPIAEEMAGWLLARQCEDGSWAGDPATTAAVVSAFAQVQARPETQANPALDVRLGNARFRGLTALAQMQVEDGLFWFDEDTHDAQRGLVAAFVLSELADDDEFRQLVRWADLLDWFEGRDHRLDGPTADLYRVALAGRAAEVDAAWTMTAA